MRSLLLFLILAFSVAIRPAACGQKFEITFAGNQGESPRGRLVQASDGNLYGTTYNGGVIGYGTVFKLSPAGVHSVLFSFNESTGKNPEAGVVVGHDGNFYGTTMFGGKNGHGTIFKLTPAGVLTTLVSFDDQNGSTPRGELVEGKDGCLYGTTSSGGPSNYGTVFKVSLEGELTTLAAFNGANGAGPVYSLVEGTDGSFYGVTSGGGAASGGTIFRMTPAGVLTNLISFNGSNGLYPSGALVEGDDGSFYGVTRMGGPRNGGCFFKVTSGGELATLAFFDSLSGPQFPLAGTHPYGALAKGRDGSLYGVTTDGGADYKGSVFKVTTAGILSAVASLDSLDGMFPNTGIILASDGNFYGITMGGGVLERGTVFKVNTKDAPTPQDVVTTLSSFVPPKGNYPSALLAKAGDGSSYGVTTHGGIADQGSVFKVTPDGVMSSVSSFFARPDGSLPVGNLVTGKDGNLYGTTEQGGTSNYGTVFKMTTGGIRTTLVSFDGSNGIYPEHGLTVGNDGNFYGTTSAGGANSRGTFFRITPTGELTPLVSFSEADGRFRSELVKDRNGNFYGTSDKGGTYGSGSVFKVTPLGELSTLASFDGSNGSNPSGRLLLGSDGNSYGTTIAGGSGSIFKLTPQGELTALARFPWDTDSFSDGGLVEGADGNFYGTTSWARRMGRSDEGSVFKVTPEGTLTTLYLFDGVTARSAPGTPVFGSDGKLHGAGAQMVIWSLPVPPSVRTELPKAIASRSATISGLANANGQLATISFEYGLTPSYGSSAAAAPGTVTGRSSTTVSAKLSGLLPNTTYYYRITAANSNGTTSTTEASFTTAPNTPPVPSDDLFARSSVVTTLPVLENDTDADGDPLTVTAVTQGTLGTVTTDGITLTYTPGPQFRGADSFSYTVSDGFDTATARVELWGPFTRTVFSRNSAVPGAGQDGSGIAEGALFTSFGELSLNSSGKLAFTASYGVPGGAAELSVFGVEAEAGKSTVVARRGEAAPGTDGASFAFFKDPLLNEAGDIALLATLSGGDTTKKNKEGIWIRSGAENGGSGTEIVARTGTQPSGVPAGAQWKSFTSVALTSRAGTSANATAAPANGSWALAFTGFMVAGPGGVNAGSDMGLWFASPNGVVLALREGQKLEIAGMERQLRTFAALMPLSNTTGQGSGISTGRGVAVQAFFKDGMQAVLQVSLAEQGDGAGPSEGGVVIEAIGLPGDAVANLSQTASKFGIPSQSSSGAVTAWLGSLTGKVYPTALFERNRSEPEFLRLLVRTGDKPAELDGATFSALRSVAVNDQGSALFFGKIAGRGVSKSNDEGLWWRKAGSDSADFQLLARKGTQPPGVPQGARWNAFASFALPDEQMGPLFTATLVSGSGKKAGPGGIRSDDDQGLWAVDSKGTLQLVAQEGQEVILDGSGARKQIKSFTLLRALPGSPAQRHSFGTNGQIAYRALLDDGSEALVTVQLP